MDFNYSKRKLVYTPINVESITFGFVGVKSQVSWATNFNNELNTLKIELRIFNLDRNRSVWDGSYYYYFDLKSAAGTAYYTNNGNLLLCLTYLKYCKESMKSYNKIYTNFFI